MIKIMPQAFFIFKVAMLGTMAVPYVLGGIYIGGQTGFSIMNAKHLYVNNDVDPSQSGTAAVRSTGFLYGAQLGYLSIVNSKAFWFAEVAGVFGSPKFNGTLMVDGGTASDGNFNVKRNRDLQINGGIGMRLNPLVGFYGHVGVDFMKYTGNYTNLNFQTPNTYINSASAVALTPGIGFMFTTGSWIFKLDYTYALNRTPQFRSAYTPINNANRGLALSSTEHRFMIHFNYHFG